MSEKLMTRREYRAIKENADRKALYAPYFKPIKAVTVFTLVASIMAGGSASAMAATTSPSTGSAVTAYQAASAPYETVTGVTDTANNGLNIDVDMSDPSTALSVNTLSDDGQGHYAIQVIASGSTAGDWTNLIGKTFTSPSGTYTATVSGINGSTIDLNVSAAPVPSVTPTFTATGSSTGPAPVAAKTDPTAVDDSAVLDTSKQTSVTADVLANDTASPGYTFDPASLVLINPITGAPTTSQTGNATLTVVNGKIVITAVSNWSGFTQGTYTAKEQWIGPGAEPSGWVPGTVTGTLKVQVIGAQATQPSPTDCTVQAAPAGGKGFSVMPMATSGSGGAPACNFTAVADTVTVAPDATQGTGNVGANDTTTNSSYTVDPSSIEFQQGDGTFAKDVVVPGQYEVSYNSVTGLTTVKRLGSYSGKPTILYRASESKLDSYGNKIMGGNSSALLTMDFQPVPTTPTPVEPVVPTQPTTPAPVVVPETPVAATDNTPVVVSSAAGTRPFSNLGDTASDFGGPTQAQAEPVVANATPQGIAELIEPVAFAIVFGLLMTGLASTSKARHRKPQASDVSA